MRQDTKLESDAAEFLVLGNLSLMRIPSFKSYVNTTGYDLIATNPESNRSARIQVKSRWKTGAAGFIINNFGNDFVVVVLLHRGASRGAKPVLEPKYLVFQTKMLKRLAKSKSDDRGRIDFKHISILDSYTGNWTPISAFLGISLPNV
jgi:hypothetical protein